MIPTFDDLQWEKVKDGEFRAPLELDYSIVFSITDRHTLSAILHNDTLNDTEIDRFSLHGVRSSEYTTVAENLIKKALSYYAGEIERLDAIEDLEYILGIRSTSSNSETNDTNTVDISLPVPRWLYDAVSLYHDSYGKPGLEQTFLKLLTRSLVLETKTSKGKSD